VNRCLLIGVVVLCASAITTGCLPVDYGSPTAELSNYSDETVTIAIEGTDEVHVLKANSGDEGDERRCVGTGVVVTGEDGSVLGEFDGPICPSTSITVKADQTVEVSDDLTTRAP
jgi:hypothetical protein